MKESSNQGIYQGLFMESIHSFLLTTESQWKH